MIISIFKKSTRYASPLQTFLSQILRTPLPLLTVTHALALAYLRIEPVESLPAKACSNQEKQVENLLDRHFLHTRNGTELYIALASIGAR